MESQPLGLRLRFDGEDEDVFVDLHEDCVVRRGSQRLTPRSLMPGVSLLVDSRTGPLLDVRLEE